MEETELVNEAADSKEQLFERAVAAAEKSQQGNGTQIGGKDRDRLVLTIAAGILAIAFVFSSIFINMNSGIAATVDGEKITEAEVNEYIADFRKSQGATDDETWSVWLASSKMTPQALREEVITGIAQLKLLKKAAKESGVELSSADIAKQIQTIKDMNPTDAAYRATLEKASMTEQELRESLEVQLLESELRTNSAFAEKYQSLATNSKITINEMPKKVPYATEQSAK